MDNKQQTAVEWLIDQMLKQGYFDGNKPLSFTNLDHLQQQAKEMEKERMLKFGIQCQLDFIKSDGIRTVDDIFNETYGGGEQ
jgi:hypothetical protein